MIVKFDIDILEIKEKTIVKIPNPIIPLGRPEDILPDDIYNRLTLIIDFDKYRQVGVWSNAARDNVIAPILAELEKVGLSTTPASWTIIEVLTLTLHVHQKSFESVGITDVQLENLLFVFFDSKKFTPGIAQDGINDTKE